jgi:hypothetical protein
MGSPASRWRSVRATNAIGRSHEVFKRRIETEAVLPTGKFAAMGFRFLLASRQIFMREANGWQNRFERPFMRTPETQ